MTLQKIDTKEIMTAGEAKRKYSDYKFYFVRTKTVDWADRDEGYVAYIAENEDELWDIEIKSPVGRSGISGGRSSYKGVEIGGVYVD
ncbi:MAG: hypothetical protein LBE35_05135 [Clostridiales bacterium]|jgi:hypothetical protein|nr:hypothetical protein [Clostridiales bacterium]